MTDDRLPFRDALARAAVPLAALAAMAALALREIDPVGSAESVYLAVLATAGLLAASFLAPAPAWESGIGSVLATAIVWALPAGPGRGAAMVLLLAGALAVAAARWWVDPHPLAPSPTRTPRPPGEGEPPPSWLSLLALSLGIQVLLRGGEVLFRPELNVRTLVVLVALPVAGAVATAFLARRHGDFALIAAGTVVLLAPGWNVAATLGLVALAAGDQLARPDLGRIAKAAALLAILAPIAWEPAPGVAAAAAALVLARPKEGPFVALAAAAGLAVFALRDLGWAWTAWLPFLLLPASLLPQRDQRWSAVAGLALAVAVPRHPDLAAMAAPLALLALTQKGGGAPLPGEGRAMGEGSGVRGPQAAWTTALLLATALLASYPWLRPTPLQEALGLFGLALTPLSAAAVVAVFLLLFLIGSTASRRQIPMSGAGLAAGALFLAALVQIPAPGTPLVAPAAAVVLDAARPGWRADVSGQPAGSVIVESSLSNGAVLPNGTPVATVRLRGKDGDGPAWTLRAGTETGEWAALRPDVAAASTLVSPRPWISWVAGDFFGQRYRSVWTVDPGPFTELRLERNPALPPEVSLALHRIEVRR